MATNSTALKGRRRNGSKSVDGENGHSAFYSLPTLYRGIYNRVARKVGCDPSYVSRVARGERTSTEICRALELEIRRTLELGSRKIAQLSRGSRSLRASRT